MAILFPQTVEREHLLIVDGYSNKKTLEAAIKDFGRYIEKTFKNGEGNALISVVNEGISESNTPYLPANRAYGGYFFEWEEVGCASRWDGESETMEYRPGSYYFVIGMVKSET